MSQRVIPETDHHVTATTDRYVRLSRAERIKRVCQTIAETHTFAAIAAELDKTFCGEGRPVSTGLLHNTLADHERNYLRAEWLAIFAEYSDDLAVILADARGNVVTPVRKLSAEDKLVLLEQRLIRELGTLGARLVAEIEAPQQKARR